VFSRFLFCIFTLLTSRNCSRTQCQGGTVLALMVSLVEHGVHYTLFCIAVSNANSMKPKHVGRLQIFKFFWVN